MRRNTTNVEQKGAHCMNEMVRKYIEETHMAIDAAKREEREKVLVELGLHTIEREYATVHYSSIEQARAAGYPNWEHKNGVAVYYRDIYKDDIEITDEEYELIVQLKEQRDLLMSTQRSDKVSVDTEVGNGEYLIIPNEQFEKSHACTFCNTIKWIMWICGSIYAIMLILYEYNIQAAFTVFCLCGITGSIFKCMEELFRNIGFIATAARGMMLKKKQ